MTAAPIPLTEWLRLTEDGLEPRLVIVGTSVFVMAAGAAVQFPLLLAAGAVTFCMGCRSAEQLVSAAQRSRVVHQLALKLLQRCGPYTVDGVGSSGEAAVPETAAEHSEEPSSRHPRRAGVDSAGELVDDMLQTSRYALLLRPETAPHLEPPQLERVIGTLDEQMALCPEGLVLVGHAAERATLGQGVLGPGGGPDTKGENGAARVEAYYLDRWCVTNADYQAFVDAGGYEEMELWHEEALPALFDFVDSTGASGPLAWSKGRRPRGEENLPVVGVSWFEACAYARWVGKRLPTDAEWTKACAWPIESAPGRIAQRRYPWGESFDAGRANLWSARVGAPVAVDGYPGGATVAGVEQMIGNVWEWTSDSLDAVTPDSVRFPTSLKTVRGGAFNTYFENQATCHFQSAENPLARRANIGFRLALDMAGLASPA